MTNSTSTPFSKRCEILGELWVAYKNDPEFEDFIQYNDLGLPLAYAITTDMFVSTVKTEMFVNETWDLLLSGLEIDDDNFESLDDILGLDE